MNKKKSEDSNLKRLESLRIQAEEFKQKKSQIRSDLLSTDASVAKNKKVLFDEYEDEVIEAPIVQILNDKEEDEIIPIKNNSKEATFVKIEPNLKELFSNDAFEFKFSNVEEELKQESSDDDEDSDSDSLFKQPITKIAKIEEQTEQKASIITKFIGKFLPDFTTDDQIRDAITYFSCKKTDDELREDWPTRRETLVEEYKKKHKRMIRIKKNKDNTKLFSWKIKKSK